MPQYMPGYVFQWHGNQPLFVHSVILAIGHLVNVICIKIILIISPHA